MQSMFSSLLSYLSIPAYKLFYRKVESQLRPAWGWPHTGSMEWSWAMLLLEISLTKFLLCAGHSAKVDVQLRDKQNVLKSMYSSWVEMRKQAQRAIGLVQGTTASNHRSGLSLSYSA